MYPLHSGQAFGLAGRILICLSGLFTSALCVTGFVIWRKKAAARRASALAAHACAAKAAARAAARPAGASACGGSAGGVTRDGSSGAVRAIGLEAERMRGECCPDGGGASPRRAATPSWRSRAPRGPKGPLPRLAPWPRRPSTWRRLASIPPRLVVTGVARRGPSGSLAGARGSARRVATRARRRRHDPCVSVRGASDGTSLR